MKDNLIKDKSFAFAVKIVNLCKNLKIKEPTLSKQLIRSSTSIGANINEAQFSPSKIDFVNKMNISLKEANETVYWIELLYKTNYIDKIKYDDIIMDLIDIKNLLISIVKNSKE